MANRRGYKSIIDLVQHEDIYPNANVACFEGRFYPSFRKLAQSKGSKAARHAVKVPRADVKSVVIALLNF